MKTVNFFITAGLLIATTAFGTVNTQALEISETQLSSTTASNNSLTSCADNVKSIYTAQYPEYAEIIDEIVDTISSSTEFIQCFENEGAIAFQIIEDSLMDAIDTSRTFNTTRAKSYSVAVPTINQLCYHPGTGKELRTYCGPASALQALIGNGKLSNIAENQNSLAIYTAGNEMGTNSSGTNISKLTAYMKDYYTSTTYTYKTKAFTSLTYDKAIDFVVYSLSCGAAPIIRIDDTSVLNYYSGHSFTHYVTISKVNLSSNTVTLVDPHYDSAYRCSHTISMSEFESLVNYNGWISVFTNVSEGSYIYE